MASLNVDDSAIVVPSRGRRLTVDSNRAARRRVHGECELPLGLPRGGLSNRTVNSKGVRSISSRIAACVTADPACKGILRSSSAAGGTGHSVCCSGAGIIPSLTGRVAITRRDRKVVLSLVCCSQRGGRVYWTRRRSILEWTLCLAVIGDDR